SVPLFKSDSLLIHHYVPTSDCVKVHLFERLLEYELRNFCHVSFAPFVLLSNAQPKFSVVVSASPVWNLIEDHPIASPLDFSWIMYRRTSGSSPFRSFSISASIDTIDFTWSGMDRASVMTSSSFCHL